VNRRLSSVAAAPDSRPPTLLERARLPRAARPWYLRLIAAASTPLMALIVLFACVWMRLVPAKRHQLEAARARIQAACPWYVALWLFACVLLDRWPLLVLTILAAGGFVGLIVAGPSAMPLAFVSAVAGASLAPVFARDLPAWLFPRL
jgi:hypothetical protein